MKRLLIISPHFVPVNAPDMHRIRQMLPFLLENNWQTEIITVDPKYIEINSTDPLLQKTIPPKIKIHHIRAFSVEATRKFGLGSLSLRSYFFFRKKGNELIKSGKFDLVFFSTTAFHVMALGPYWKKKFGIPFILDIQDPWRSDFYLDKPKSERPPKFWIAYNIDKYLERKTVPYADGIISVSEEYIHTFHNRYPATFNTPTLTLPFSGSKIDFQIAGTINQNLDNINLDQTKKNIIYIGRGGHDLKFAVSIFFKALQLIKQEDINLYSTLKIWFIGTSYAPKGTGIKTIAPVAQLFNVNDIVEENTDRLPYFQTLSLLLKADLLFVPGSTDKGYTASKIYPYILSERPLLTIFNKTSSVVDIMKNTGAGVCLTFDSGRVDNHLATKCKKYILELLNPARINETNWINFKEYTSQEMTAKFSRFANDILKKIKTG